MEEFINHQITLVQEEKRIDVEDTQKLLATFTPSQLQKRGVALLGLRVTGKYNIILIYIMVYKSIYCIYVIILNLFTSILF